MKLVEIFEKVADFRVINRSWHKLSEILVLSLCALLSGADDFEEIEEYGNQKEEFLSFVDLDKIYVRQISLRLMLKWLQPVSSS